MSTIKLSKPKVEEAIARHPGDMMGHGWSYWLIVQPSGEHRIAPVQGNRPWDPWNDGDYVAPLPVLSDEDTADIKKGEAWRENILDFYAEAWLRAINGLPNDLDIDAPFGHSRGTDPDEYNVIECPFHFKWD